VIRAGSEPSRACGEAVAGGGGGKGDWGQHFRGVRRCIRRGGSVRCSSGLRSAGGREERGQVDQRFIVDDGGGEGRCTQSAMFIANFIVALDDETAFLALFRSLQLVATTSS